MAHDEERAAQRPGVPGEQQGHLPGVGFVKACRGLVRQDDARLEQYGPRNGDPLLFPTRQRPHFPGGADVHLFEQAAPAPDQGFRDAPSGEGGGQEHVFQRFQLREKLEVLKDETDMLPFHDGSFKIATRAKSPIIPIAISNSANIWEANFPKMSPTHVVIEYGKPIIPSELDRDTQRHLGAYTQSIIKEMLIKNKELV